MPTGRHLVIAALALVLLPFVLSVIGLGVTSATEVVVFSLACMALNILVGYTGLTSFGHGAWFGLAAYAAGMSQRDWFAGSFFLPLALGLAIVVALAAALTRAGMFANLWTLWSGRSGHALPPVLLGDLLGPIAAVAAVAGLGVCMSRGRLAAATVAALALGSIGADFASGALGVATPALAAVAAGVAIARLAALVRWPLAQPFVGAAAGFVIVLAAAMLRL